jgi:asparaginyl-tRNA synthetase
MNTSSIASILNQQPGLQNVSVKGWVRTFRANRFIALTMDLPYKTYNV